MIDRATEEALSKAKERIERAMPLLYGDAPDEGVALYREALDALASADDEVAAVVRARAACLDGLGAYAGRTGRLDEAEDHHREALALRRRLEEAGEDGPRVRVAMAVSFMNLASVMAAGERVDDAVTFTGEALEHLDPEDPEPTIALYRMGARQSLGMALAGAGRVQEAADTFAEAVGELRGRIANGDEESAATLLPPFCQALLHAGEVHFRGQDFDGVAEYAAEAALVSESIYEEIREPQALGQYLTAQLQLLAAHEAAGRWAKAEDALFKALDVAGPHDELVQRGRSFYETLLSLDDEALEAGDLPRDEVEESLEDLMARAAEAQAEAG